MAQSRGEKPDASVSSALVAAGRTAGFIIAAGLALAILAAVVLLPAWQRCQEARRQRDALAGEVWTHQQLIDYKQQLAEAIRSNPLQTQRLLMQQQNYRRAGETAIHIDEAPSDPAPIAMLAARVPRPAPTEPFWESLALRVQAPRVRRGLLLLAAVLVTAAMVLFAPEAKRR